MASEAPWHDEDLLHEMYVVQDLSLSEMGRQLGTTRTTVKKYLERFEIGDRYPCPTCGRKFFARNGAARHHKDEHGETLRELESKEGDIPCPDCEQAFDTEEGLNSHRGLVHDVRVPVECKHCGGTETFPPSIAQHREYCDTDCMAAAYREITGEDHPKFVEKPVLTCPVCGDEFEVYPYEVEVRSTCGKKACRYEVQGAKVRGEESVRYKQEEVECAQCGASLHRPPWRISTVSRHFCRDTDCFPQWLRENTGGQDSPNWRGGVNLRDALVKLLPTSWPVARTHARESAQHQCQMCDVEEREMVKELDIHHLVPVLSGGTNGEYNTVALCDTCHRKADVYLRGDVNPVYLDYTDEELPPGRLSSSDYQHSLVE